MEQVNFESYFKARKPDYEFLITYMRKAIGVKHVNYEDISVMSMTKVKDFLMDDKKKTPSTVKNYMAVIASVCNAMACDGLIKPVNFKLVGRIKADKTQNVALTETEINMFVNYYNRIKDNPKSIVERDVLTLFLIEMFTGARASDCETFNEGNISNGILTYVSKKTHTLTRVPAHKMLPVLFANMPKKTYKDMSKNRIIKATAKRLGIVQLERRNYHGEMKFRPRYEYLATHTARRTFITTLLDKNVPIATVSKMSGHQSADMTMRYYCSDALNIDEAAMSFFR